MKKRARLSFQKLMPLICTLAFVLLFYAQALAQQQKKSPRRPPSKISINFVDVELASFAKFISDTTGVNLVFDERLKGKITVIAPEGLTKEETFNLFSSVLEVKGFTLVPAGTAFKIVPVSEARQKGLPLQTAINDAYQVQLISLSYISPDDAVRLLTPLISKDGYIAPFAQGNYILIVDTALNIEKITDILDIIDAEPEAEDVEIISLKYSSADALARIINEGFAQQPQAPGERARAGGPRVIPEARLNALILLGSPAEKERIKTMIERLDVPGAEVQGGINVYFLQHADAEELARTLQALITGTRLPQAQQQRTPQAVPQAQPQVQQAAGAPSERITVTPDKATNSLVILASQSDYQTLLNIIQKLDRPRRQVFVEAMIVEASLDNLRELGTKWRATALDDGEPVFVGGVGTIDTNSILNIISGLSGLTIGGLGNFFDAEIQTIGPDGTVEKTTLNVPGFAALFSLSDFRNAVNVLSTPHILTSDNQEAEIVVGQNVPFITASSVATAGSLVTNTIERRDVGIKLRITPHITEGDSVRLDIYQEISAVVPTTSLVSTEVQVLTQVGPTTTMRSTKTSVTVDNQETIVIGGLISETMADVVTKVPVLGDIPVLGYLFKSKSQRKQKTNLLVFISPRIIKAAEDIRDLTRKKEAEFKETKQGYKTDELLVKFKEDVPDEEALSVIALNKAEVLKKLKDRLYLVKIKDGRSVPDAVEEFSALPQVQYAEPNYIIRIDGK